MKDPPQDLYIITTARKRDTLEWEGELAPFLLSSNPDLTPYHHKVIIDSWNNIKKYTEDRGALFWEMRDDNLNHVKCIENMAKGIHAELPFSISTNNDQLEDSIVSFENKTYAERVKEFGEDIGLIFDGRASERLATHIEKLIGE